MVSRTTLILILCAIYLQLCTCFSIAPSKAATSRLFKSGTRVFRPVRLFSSSENLPEKDTEQEEERIEDKESNRLRDDTNDGGALRMIFLAVPLFCKFVLVLLIKFMTDLVVIPMLFLYRQGQKAKRRLRKMFSRNSIDKTKPNGET